MKHATKHMTSQRGQDPRRAIRGWTFVETLIVIAIVLILTGTVGFVAFRYIGRANVVAARSQIESFSMALQAYQLDNGHFPSEQQGLDALFSRPSGEPVPNNWSGPYVARPIPNDPWGNAYVFRNPGPDGLPFGISSLGADGLEGGDGDDADVQSWGAQ